MSKNKRLLASFLVILIIICSIGNQGVEVEGKSKNKTKTNNDDDKIIVVSLGDSYSSGEGNIPYGSELSKEELINNKEVFCDWAAHRSPLCWAGQLKFNVSGYDEPQSLGAHHYYKSDEAGKDTIQWYFDAASGAVTDYLFKSYFKHVHQDERNFFGTQTFYYDDICELPPQIDIIKNNNLYGKVDYVTCTMGGNNIGFTEIIGTAALPISTIIKPNELKNLLIKAWNNFYVPDGVRDQLIKYYRTIAAAVGPQAKIIVVGYPQLIGGCGVFFDNYDKTLIDVNQEVFDLELERIVNDLKVEGVNIDYISVYDKFKNHGMESLIPWINGVTIKDQLTQDIDERTTQGFVENVISSFSGHPNALGQIMIAEEVQKYIDNLNGDHSNHVVQSNENKMAYQAYLDYMYNNKYNILRYDWHALEGAKFIKSIKEAIEKFDLYCISDNKNRGCSLCDVTGDGFPELFTIQVSAEGESANLHVMKYDPDANELIEILLITDIDKTAGNLNDKSKCFSIAVTGNSIIVTNMYNQDINTTSYSYDNATGLMISNDNYNENNLDCIAIFSAKIFNAPHINLRLEGLNYGECCLELTTRITGMIPEIRYKDFPELNEKIVRDSIYNFIITELGINVPDGFVLDLNNVYRIDEGERASYFKVDYTDNLGKKYHFYTTAIPRSDCPGITYVDYDNTLDSSKYKDDADILDSIDTGLAFYVQDYYDKEQFQNKTDGSTIVSLNDEGYLVFGRYEQDDNQDNGLEPIEWIILDENENEKLLISRYVLDNVPYNNEQKEVTWETCTLRSWLNNDFINNAFSADEQSLITTVNNENSDFVVEGGNNTDDKVFCLSMDEAVKYYKFSYDQYSCFGYCKELITESTAYAKEQGVWTKTLTADDDHIGYAEAPKGYIKDCIGKTGTAWWLRTSGWFNDTACAVMPNGYVGADYEFGVSSTNYGVRPVVWVNIKDDDISDRNENSTVKLPIKDINEANIGDIITFGNYPQTAAGSIKPIDWEVLDIQDDKMLIISKYGLEQHKYNEKYASVAWDSCTLRTWLNNDFLNKAFTESEQELIVDTKVKKKENPIYSDSKWAKDTIDKIFLLSIDEVYNYFNLTVNAVEHSSIFCYGNACKCQPTTYAIASGVNLYDANNDDESCYWWLRNPGWDSWYAAVCYGDKVDAEGLDVNKDYVAIRPAMWISINS